MFDFHSIESLLPPPTAPVVAALTLAGCFLVAMVVFFALSARASKGRHGLARAREAAEEVAGHGLLVVESSGRVIEANDLARRLLWSDAPGEAHPRLPEPIRLLLKDPAPQHHTLRIAGRQLIDLAISGSEAGSGGESAVRGILLRDVTEDLRGRDHLLRLAHFDSLTGLGNRRLFIDRLKQATLRAQEAGGSVALLYIDIDRFKEVNDSLGHGAGDELLKVVATRFRGLMQQWAVKTARDDFFVARLSGDEFAIVALNYGDTSDVGRLAQGVLDGMAEPVPFEGRIIPCSASIGVSLLPDHGLDVEDLVKAADAALYVAKESGRGRYVVYEHAFRAQAEYHRKIENGLRQAISRGELRLCYQPKIDVASGTVAGFEALLRWHSEELGFVSPKDLIPVAEERGLICEIGAWCVDEACRQLRSWHDAGFDIVPVSVNVSSAQFADSDLQEIITSALVRHDIEPVSFEIELTESLILADNDTTALTLRDLRSIGVRVALDDFGTGYSALTYLNRFPLDTVKMDRGFLRGIEDDEAAAGIASAVIAMSHSLGFEVVAEGVDSERQAKLLRSMGCDQIQGFLYAPALPALEATRFLAPRGMARPVVPSSSASAVIDEILAPTEPAAQPGEVSHALQEPMVSNALPERPEETPGAKSVAHGGASEVLSPPERGSQRPAETRTLVIDDEQGSFGQIAVRMMRLGADVHFVQDMDEATLFVNEDEPTLELLVVSPAIDLDRLGALRERLEKASSGIQTRILVVGGGLDDRRRQAFREARIDWLITGPVEDTDLRFFIGAARFHGDRPQHQRAVRIPLETTAWIRVGGDRRIGALTSLSRRGAFIETADEYAIDQPVRLEFKANDTRVRVFGHVIYRHAAGADSSPYRAPGIGVVFYEPDGDTTDQIAVIIEQIWSRHLP
ncbi:EAL domain-containing protein [Myxococcota bacterium]|nr:EAL domain-containing protein [Myxococcota bacterium]